ncbi:MULTISPECIES: MFS transporter [unclassified Streptomyces]|uniref:MFS transporter n=1 Tax=unclassified Streptomyces TaxID=2593676 RepID=UPI00073B69C5|nr:MULTISPECIES: MFS transporter [unclassified Streptomyces]ODA72685.1 Inner membrane metabolite transport protein YhjE [Streptomyces sp. AVP053U2]
MKAAESIEVPAKSPAGTDRTVSRRVLLASTIGSAIEWYDFYLYSTAAALVLGPLFFPNQSPTAGVLASFATYAAGFVARPLGGIVFGHFGDRIGRKSMLVLTLLIMGTATFLVGVLPTYEQAGILAPVLLVLLRVVQGIGLGGEWGGGVLMSGEHAPLHRRGLFTSFPASGFPLGLFGSTVVFQLVSQLPEDQMMAWGWRLPFLASVLLVVVGVFVRLKVAESPEFVRVQQAGEQRRVPLAGVLRQGWTPVLRGAFASLGLAMTVSIYSVYLLSYASSGPRQGHGTDVLNGLLIGALTEAVLLPVAGLLSDRLGRRPLLLFGYAVCGLVGLVAPHWLTSGNQTLIVLTFVLAMGIGHAAIYGAISALLIDMFPPEHRYSALAVTYQLGATIASFGPLVAVALAGSAHTAVPGIRLLWGCLAAAALAVAFGRIPRPGEVSARSAE